MGLITQKDTTSRTHVKSAVALLHLVAERVKMAVNVGEIEEGESSDRLQQRVFDLIEDLEDSQ